MSSPLVDTMESPLKWLLVQSDKLDERLRFHDFHTHRTIGGRLDRLFHINRHTLSALTLPCIVRVLMVLASASACRILMSLISLAVVGGTLGWFMHRSAQKNWPCADGPRRAKHNGAPDGRGDLGIRQG